MGEVAEESVGAGPEGATGVNEPFGGGGGDGGVEGEEEGNNGVTGRRNTLCWLMNDDVWSVRVNYRPLRRLAFSRRDHYFA